MPTSNPLLSQRRFSSLDMVSSSLMTLQGTVNRLGFLSILMIVIAYAVWQDQSAGKISLYVWPCLIAAFIFAVITIFNPKISMFTAPLYAVLEGVVLGSISAFFNTKYPGIVSQALMLTFGVLITMLLAYKMKFIRATEGFRTGVIAATGAICLVYIADMVLGSFFGMNVPYIHEGGLIGIGVSIGIVIIASLNLILDFDTIEKSISKGSNS